MLGMLGVGLYPNIPLYRLNIIILSTYINPHRFIPQQIDRL